MHLVLRILNGKPYVARIFKLRGTNGVDRRAREKGMLVQGSMTRYILQMLQPDWSE